MADPAQDLMVAMIAVVFLFGGCFYFAIMVRRFSLRNHVWAFLHLERGTDDLFLTKPLADESLQTKYGRYMTSPTSFTMFNGGWHNGGIKQLFEYCEGVPHPTRHTTRYGISKNPGNLIKLAVSAHEVIPARTMEVFMKQHLFRDIYQRHNLLLIIGIALAVLFFLILGLYAR